MNKQNRTIHGIDPYAPGGLDALFAHHHAIFGDAVMEAVDGSDGGDEGAGAGDGETGKGGDQGKDGTGGADTGNKNTIQGKSDDAGKEDGDVWDDPAKARTEIERLRRENGNGRVNAKTQAAQDAKNELTQSIGKALGLIKGDEKADPEKLTQQLSERDAAATQAQRELAVYRTAAKNGGDPDALLDSRAFLAKIADLDPTNTDAISAAIKDAVKDNQKLSAARAAGKGNADFSGGSGEQRNNQKTPSLADAISGHYGT